MALQQLRDCSFNVRGSYTNSVTVNLVTHSYHQIGTHSASKRLFAGPSSSAWIPELLLQGERLQKTAKELSRQLKSTVRAPIECDDLAKTLDDISTKTIPYILRICVNSSSRQMEEPCEHRVLTELDCMQKTMEDFSTKISARGSKARYLVKTVRKSLIVSRDKIYAALFEPMASSLSNPIRVHHVEIIDFFGSQWSLPIDLCLNRQLFFSILRAKFKGGPGEAVVLSRQFTVFQQDGSRPIQALEWTNTINDGDNLQLSVLVDNERENACPRCEKTDKVITGKSPVGWATCLRCDSAFNTAPSELEASEPGTSLGTRDHNWKASVGPGQVSPRAEFRSPQPRYSSFRRFSIRTMKEGPETSTNFPGPMVCCSEGPAFPKIQESDQNVEVLTAWRSITSNPQFKDIDINELCSQFMSRARCDGKNVVLDPLDIDSIIRSVATKR